MPRVLISDELSPRAVEIFKERGVEVTMNTSLTPDQLKQEIGKYDGLAVRSATKVTKAVLEAAKNLKVVGRAGIGVDNIDIPAATARGVVVMNTPYGNSITTAEHAIALMMALARELPAADRSTQAGKWEKSRFMGVELTAKTLGVIGCGNVGSIVADRALGRQEGIVGDDLHLQAERAVQLGVEKVELEDLFARADFITLHTPLTEQTKNIIDAKAIAKMKHGVRIINCARGGLVVEEALKAALDSGKVAGAAIDVFPIEPAKENILFGHPRLIATPHLGASTSEAQENVALQVAEQMADYLMTGAVVNALNMPSLSAEDAARLKPYLKLAEELGSFAGQITDVGLSAVAIEYAGHAGELNVKPLTQTILAALLRPQLDTVNLVNAPALCKERNIKIEETRSTDATDYQTLITVTVTSANKQRSVAGTLFGGDKPRIVAIEDISLEAELGPTMLFVRNQDKPGFIGNLGRTLGEAGINIATFHLGRKAAGEDAICLVQVDQPLNEAVLAHVCALPNVMQVRQLRF
jgi:D-3-phosphoglycerate dehydrogenase